MFQVINCLPTDLPWKIPKEEYSKRRDFTKECVFTIDPATARDLDDALSCKQIGPGRFTLSVVRPPHVKLGKPSYDEWVFYSSHLISLGIYLCRR